MGITVNEHSGNIVMGSAPTSRITTFPSNAQSGQCRCFRTSGRVISLNPMRKVVKKIVNEGSKNVVKKVVKRSKNVVKT